MKWLEKLMDSERFIDIFIVGIITLVLGVMAWIIILSLIGLVI